MNPKRERRTEDIRILAHDALSTRHLIRLALRAGLVDDFEVRAGVVGIAMGHVLIELPERDARIFLWGLIRGRERTLARSGT